MHTEPLFPSETWEQGNILGIAVFYLLYRGGFGFFGEDICAVLKLDHAAVGAVGDVHQFVVGADLSDWKTGNDDIIREYMKPIPR